ncbi:MAG: hypothetical protein HRT88_11640 [Lentisphaeraceae bacterium]|nr:hypothetical protein [Lentisphaeraceae bacterium]
MIAETLLPFAKLLDGSDLIGENCFLFERCAIDFSGLRNNIEKAKGKKINIPIHFFGQEKKSTVNGFAGSGKANASKATFQKFTTQFKDLEKGKDVENPYPNDYFPHKSLEFERYSVAKLLDALEFIQDASEEQLRNLFNSDLQAFSFETTKDNETAVKKRTCLPVTANAPGVVVHALLVLNAVNLHASLLGFETEKNFFSAETYRFMLLLWFLDSLKGAQLEIESKTYALSFSTDLAGNIPAAKTLLKANMLVTLNKNQYFGGKELSENSVLAYLQELTSDNNADTIKIAGQSYTAPKTGISPTSAYFDPVKKDNSLTDLVRNGADVEEMLQRIDNYTTLISGTRFSLGPDLYYYFYPEAKTKAFVEKYLKAIKRHVIETRSLKDQYYKEIKKSKSVKKEEGLARIEQLRTKLWVDLLLEMNTDTLLFAFEKNAGNSNQPFFSWSKVYSGLETLRVFTFLYYLDSPKHSYPLTKTLNLTGHNLSEGWALGEKERLIDLFLSKKSISWTQEWTRWRKFFLRSNMNESDFDSSCWEGAFYFIMLLNQIQNNTFEPEQSGNALLKKFDKQMEIKMAANTQRIKEYLLDVFRSDNEKIIADIDAKSSDYSRFVDTTANESKWQAVVDGLICGWALKTIARKLRPEKDDYKKVIGGRSLSKMSPFEVNEKMVELREKVNRQDQDAWNVDAPMEKLLLYVQKKANSETVRLFSDALSLGFMRFDKNNK